MVTVAVRHAVDPGSTTHEPQTSWIVGGALAAAAVAAGTGIGTAQAASGTPAGVAPPVGTATAPVPPADEPAQSGTELAENEVPITGDALGRASAAALAAVGGGTVTETGVDDEEGFYEVEVTRADGSQVDVDHDERFSVLDSIADGGEPR